MKTVLEVLQAGANYLALRGVPHARRQVEEVLSHVLDVGRMQLYLDFERPLVETEVGQCRDFLRRLAHAEPWQYLVGHIPFYHCDIEVNREVLIPRQETEILVDRVVQVLDKAGTCGKSLWDVCCGSGCIGIALKKRFPDLQVTLSDCSPAALTLARQNAERNGVAVEFLQGDLWAPFGDRKANVIVCNPPYVSESEFEKLEPQVRCHEPALALVAGRTGMEFYERLAQHLKTVLSPGGSAWFEIGSEQGERVQALFADWPHQALMQDWAGRDRFFFLERD